MRDNVKKMGIGTIFEEIPGSVFSSVIIPLPLLDEKHKIIAHLNEFLLVYEALKKITQKGVEMYIKKIHIQN